MKIIKWIIAVIAIMGICTTCLARETGDVWVSPPWGLAGDEQSAEDIPIRDESAQWDADNLMDLISGILDGTETFTSLSVTDLEVTGTLTTGTLTSEVEDTVISVTALTVSGASILNGGLIMDTDAFTVDDGSGNTAIDGTLSVGGASTLTGAVGAAGSITLGAGADLIGSSTSDIDINSVFTTAGATGNTLIAGTLTAEDTLTVTGVAIFTAESTFNSHINLGAGDDLVGSSTSDINMNEFDVAGATGNTVVGGTLGVTGTSIFTGAITANSSITLGAGDDLIGSSTSDITINTAKFNVAGATGNVQIAGDITDAIDDVDINDSLTVAGAATFTLGLTSNAHITLGAGDDLVGSSTSDINMNAFDVAGATGNTVVGGTLGVTGVTTFTGAVTANGGITLGAGDDLIGSSTSDIDINSVFTVAGASGNTLVGGTLTVTGQTTFNSHANLGAGDDLVGSSTSDINMNKFDVAGSDGTTVIDGTLNVTGNVVFEATTEFADNTCTITNATGAIATDSTVTVGTNIIVAGTISDATDDVDIDDSMTVSGTAVFEGTTVFADNTCTITDATGAFATDSTVTVGTNIIVAGTITDATDDVDIADSCTISGTLTQTGVATFAATAVFDGGQTRKQTLTGNAVTVDDSVGPTFGVIGTSARSQVNVWGFDANPNAGTDDHVYLRWRVPDGYKTDSAKLNITFSYSDAETDGDDVDFDFTVKVLTPGSGAAGGTYWDAVGVAGDHVDVDLVNGDGDEGTLMEQQINIEITAIAVDDEILIDFWVDEDQCDLATSGTVDIHVFEIEWESSE